MRNRRLGSIAVILASVFLLAAVSTVMAGDIVFQVSPKKLTKAGPVLISASGLRPGQLVGKHCLPAPLIAACISANQMPILETLG